MRLMRQCTAARSVVNGSGLGDAIAGFNALFEFRMVGINRILRRFRLKDAPRSHISSGHVTTSETVWNRDTRAIKVASIA